MYHLGKLKIIVRFGDASIANKGYKPICNDQRFSLFAELQSLQLTTPTLRLVGDGPSLIAVQTAIIITIHYIHFIMSILIKVISAQLSRDTELFSNMDPYCILRLGSQSQRTKTKDEAGKKPVWNQSFRFSNTDNNLKVIIMDEDSMADDVIGEGQVDLTRFRGNSTEQQHIVQLYYKGKAAGKVMLRISGAGGQQGNNLNQGGNAWGNNAPNNNGGWGQQSNQWGNNQPQPKPQPNNEWGMPQQNNNQWGASQPQQNNWGNQNPNNNNNSWGNQGSSWNQPPNQFGNQGGNQWGATNPNQQQPNINQFNPLLQGIFQGSSQSGAQGNPQGNQWGTQPPNNNQWGNQPPPANNQWGGNPQAPNLNNQGAGNPQAPNPNIPNPNQGWGNNPNPKPNNDIVYPDLEYKPPINNNNITPPPQQFNGQGNNPSMDVPFKLIGGMQGLFNKPNTNNQGGNPYQV